MMCEIGKRGTCGMGARWLGETNGCVFGRVYSRETRRSTCWYAEVVMRKLGGRCAVGA